MFVDIISALKVFATDYYYSRRFIKRLCLANFITCYFILGLWKSRKELSKFREVDRIFEPNKKVRLNYQHEINQWKCAVERLKDWY